MPVKTRLPLGNIQLIGPKNVAHSCCHINLRKGQSVCILGETKRKARRRRSEMFPLCSQEKVSIDSIKKEFVLRFFKNFAQLLITPCTSKI